MLKHLSGSECKSDMQVEDCHLQQLHNSAFLVLQVGLLALPVGSLKPVQSLCSCQSEQRQRGHVVVAAFMPHIH